MKKIGSFAATAAMMFVSGVATWSGLPALAAPQVAQDENTVKSAGSQSHADGQEVKRLSDLSYQASQRTREAHTVLQQKSAARAAAEKSYGGKDARTLAAKKEEAAAMQAWKDREKEQRDLQAQRSAAIAKLHGADTAHDKDVQKLESDEKTHAKTTTATKK